MAFFPRPSSPKAVWRDLRAFFATRQRHQFVFAALSVALPILLILGFVHDSYVAPPGPQMYFVDSWPLNRSDAEIIAQQKIDQKAKDQALAERRVEYQRLAKQLGIQ